MRLCAPVHVCVLANVHAINLSEFLQVLECDGVTRQMQHAVQQGTRMAIRQHEAITIRLQTRGTCHKYGIGGVTSEVGR